MSDEIDELGSAAVPPDTMGAVGPDHFVEMLSGSVAVFDKTTGSRSPIVSLDSFFAIGGSPPPGGAFNPRILFDRPSGRWFACALDRSNGFNNNHLLLAVSATEDPTGAWDKYSFLAGDANDWADFATLGVDANGVYFGWRLLNGDTGAVIAATPKADLVSGSPSLGTVTAFGPFLDMFSTPQPAVNLDGSAGGRAFFVASHSVDFANVVYRSLSWNGSTPEVSGLGTVPSPSYLPPNNFLPLGSLSDIDVGDDRLTMAIIRDDQLWTCRTVYVNNVGTATDPDRNALEWFVLDVSTASPALAQNGRVFDPGALPRHYFYPSIAPSGQDHAAMGFSGATVSEFIGAYTCGRLGSDTVDTMQSVDLVKAGEAAYTIETNGRNRWGNYSYTTVDPEDDMTLWTVQEYAEALSGADSRWGTRIVKLLAPAPTLNSSGASAFIGQTDAVVNLAGTGFFDPGTSFANRLDVTISGDGISGKSVAYTSPTSASVTFDVAANATVGARDITLTNPDGQSVTVVGGLTITASGMQPPTNLTATAVAVKSINLTWTDNTSDEKGFLLERKTGGGAFVQIKSLAPNTVSNTDGNLLPTTNYTYRIRAYKSGVQSPYSNEGDATTLAAPAPPSNLNATFLEATRIKITWTDNSVDEKGFWLERKVGDGPYQNLTALPPNRTNYSNSGLTPNTTYSYRIYSYNDSGNSAYSNEDVEATPPLPVAPTGLTATAVSSTQINLTWVDNSTDEAGFRLERKPLGGTFVKFKSVGANVTSYNNTTSLVANTTYVYRIRAFNAYGNSPYSDEATASTPPLPNAPTNLVATAVSSTRIDLSWTDTTSDELGFKVERRIGAGAFEKIVTRSANVTTYPNTGLTPNTTYTYRVRSYNANGNSVYSNQDSETTPAAPQRASSSNERASSATSVFLPGSRPEVELDPRSLSRPPRPMRTGLAKVSHPSRSRLRELVRIAPGPSPPPSTHRSNESMESRLRLPMATKAPC